TLIDNAEMARISKKLVTLDQNVPLEVPVEELAVHEPDYKHLIAFLKAMEFSTLTRRVAEKSGIEASEIAANADLSSGAAASAPAAKAQPASTGRYGELDLGDRPVRTSAPAEGKELTPSELASAHLAAEQSKKFDRSKYETVRGLDRLKAWVLR